MSEGDGAAGGGTQAGGSSQLASLPTNSSRPVLKPEICTPDTATALHPPPSPALRPCRCCCCSSQQWEQRREQSCLPAGRRHCRRRQSLAPKRAQTWDWAAQRRLHQAAGEVCACVCVCVKWLVASSSHAHTQCGMSARQRAVQNRNLLPDACKVLGPLHLRWCAGRALRRGRQRTQGQRDCPSWLFPGPAAWPCQPGRGCQTPVAAQRTRQGSPLLRGARQPA